MRSRTCALNPIRVKKVHPQRRDDQDRDFAQEILELKDGLVSKETELKEKKALCKEYKEGTQSCAAEIALIKEKIRSIPAEVIDVVKVRGDLNKKKSQMVGTRDQVQEDKQDRDSKKNEYRARRPSQSKNKTWYDCYKSKKR